MVHSNQPSIKPVGSEYIRGGDEFTGWDVAYIETPPALFSKRMPLLSTNKRSIPFHLLVTWRYHLKGNLFMEPNFNEKD